MAFLLNKYVIGGLLILLLIAGAWAYYLKTSYQIDSLSKQLIDSKQTIVNQTAVIDTYKQDFKKIESVKKDLEARRRKLEEDYKNKERTLYREKLGKPSLEELAAKRPTHIELLVNHATERTLACLESITKNDAKAIATFCD